MKKWSENGQLREEAFFIEGSPDGFWTTWHENGNRMNQIHFSLGVTDGTTRYWDVNGHIRMKEEYIENTLVSQTEYDSVGNIVSKWNGYENPICLN